MSQPVVVSVPHRLGREEAVRRLKSGFERAGSQFGGLLDISEQAWNGDRLTFRASALGQHASGLIDVLEDSIRIEVSLPWLLAKMADKLIPAIRREGTLMLEKK
ncbi:MAG: polyhydroxyalkanoic acid system family protein [Tardiphaga sp.]